MAEGPQVHRLADALRRALCGQAIREARLTPERLRPHASRLAGEAVVEVEARGKHTLIHLGNRTVLHSHLMMWGRWEVFRSGGRPRKATGRLWAQLSTDTHTAQLYNGPVLEILTEGDLTGHPTLSSLGPDPLRADYRRDELLERLETAAPSQRVLAEVLLDQGLFAGVGNIYKSEILWQAGLHPILRLRDLTFQARHRLVLTAERVLRTAYRQRFGTLPRRLWPSVGPFAVYRRAGLPCLWCGEPVRRLDTARATYFCPRCQPPPSA